MLFSRPQATKNRDRESVALLTGNHRRAMDSIDALYPASDEAEDREYRAHGTVRGASEEQKQPEIPFKCPVSENPVENHSAPAVPPLVIDDSARPATSALSQKNADLWSALGVTPGLTAPARVTSRDPVAMALVVDGGSAGIAQGSATQPNSNPPAGYGEYPRNKEAVVEDTKDKVPADRWIGQVVGGASSSDIQTFNRIKPHHRPARLQLPECVLSESVVADRPHTSQGASAHAQDQAQRRPRSRSDFFDVPKSRGSSHACANAPKQRNITTVGGLAFRDRRPSEKIAWHFRSSSPGPGGAAYTRPVSHVGNAGRGQLLDSGLTYIGSAHTLLGDGPGGPLQQNEMKLWPSSLRKSTWNKMSSEKGRARVPDTGQRVRMLCEAPELAAQLFAHYAIPMRLAGEPVMLLIPFLDCLSHLEALQGSSPVLHLGLEMAGMKHHIQEAMLALINKDEATVVFESEASWYFAEPDQGSNGGSEESESRRGGEGKRKQAGFLGLRKDTFLGCLSRVLDLLDDKYHKLAQSMPKRKGLSKNTRLPLNDLRELRGQARRDSHGGGSPAYGNKSPTRNGEDVKSPLVSISAMRDVTDPSLKQAALFKALKAQTTVSEYKRLARQVVRETMVHLDSAVKTKSRTRKEMEWLLVLRDQALTSLGLIVSAVQIQAAHAAASEDLDEPPTPILQRMQDGMEAKKAIAWGPPAWAWVVPIDIKKPIAPAMDGWYLVSGDPGPALKLLGPVGSRQKAMHLIQDFKELGIKIFNTCLLRDSSLLEVGIFDSTGQCMQDEAAPATHNLLNISMIICIHAHIDIHMCICTYACINIQVHIYTYIHTHKQNEYIYK